jgi:hypothetical protein
MGNMMMMMLWLLGCGVASLLFVLLGVASICINDLGLET